MRDKFDQSEPMTPLEGRILPILEEISSPKVRPDRSLLAYAADIADVVHEMPADGSTSDGYHTFDELYDHRMALTAALFSQWAALGKYYPHKSLNHADGKPAFGGGWFVVMATLPTGQISYHYPIQHWDKFKILALPNAEEWDGHTPADVVNRLSKWTPES